MLKVITAAAMLSMGVFVNATASSYVPFSSATQPAIAGMQLQNGGQISPKVEQVLVENHAASHWNFTMEEAWNHFNAGILVIVELNEEDSYRLEYGGDYILVLMED